MSYREWRSGLRRQSESSEEKSLTQPKPELSQQTLPEKIPLKINGFGEAHIPLAKLTKYALNPEKAPDKALAFEKALGYNLSNVEKLIENISRNINSYEMTEVEGNNYGRRFKAILELTGENGKVAKVLTAWLLDKDTKEFRLTSLYVDKK